MNTRFLYLITGSSQSVSIYRWEIEAKISVSVSISRFLRLRPLLYPYDDEVGRYTVFRERQIPKNPGPLTGGMSVVWRRLRASASCSNLVEEVRSASSARGRKSQAIDFWGSLGQENGTSEPPPHATGPATVGSAKSLLSGRFFYIVQPLNVKSE